MLDAEETKFRATLVKGITEFERISAENQNISGEQAFYLYETYGFPVEITKEMALEKGISIDEDEYQKAYESHQEKSRTSAKGFFKGGLADSSDMSIKYHTSTHLLLSCLKEILGKDTEQKGSNINPERLRFDFNSDRKLTDEEVSTIELKINDYIKQALPVTVQELPKEEALKLVTDASFADRYGDKVTVYTVGEETNPVSREICRGPHVTNTSEIGNFKIVKQENVGTGIKRIKAIIN